SLKNLFQPLAHLAGVGGILIREANDVITRSVLHLRGAGAGAALRLQHFLKFRIRDGGGRNLRVNAASGNVCVDERLYLLRNTKKIQRRIAIEVGRDLVDKAKQLGVAEDIAGHFWAMLQQAKHFVERAKLVDEVGANLDVFQQLHARVHLPLKV